MRNGTLLEMEKSTGLGTNQCASYIDASHGHLFFIYSQRNQTVLTT